MDGLNEAVAQVRAKLHAARQIAEDAFNAPTEQTVMMLFTQLCQEIELEGLDLDDDPGERVGTVH